MKRIASFVLTLLLILSLCACSLPQAKPAEEPIDELELVEEAEETSEAEAPEERPIMPEEAAPEASEQEAPSGNGTAPAGDTSGGSGQDSSGGSVTIPEPETGGDLVWIPTHGGTKYHRSARCSNMIDPIQVSRETAIANGFTACKRCY